MSVQRQHCQGGNGRSCRRYAAAGLVAATLLLAAGCAAPRTDVGAVPAGAGALPCATVFEALDRAVVEAGVQGGDVRAVPGLPYLTADRFLASFAGAATDADAFDVWVEHLRRRNLQRRAAELARLGPRADGLSLARLDGCGRRRAAAELGDAAARRRLRAAVRVPDEYARVARIAGFYPFAVPFLRLGIGDYQRGVAADYARPLADLDGPARRIAWGPAAASGPVPALAAVPRDRLGIPQLDAAQWAALARAHAPVWWVEQGGPYDLPGAPTWAGARPTVDPARPDVYVHHDFTRFGAQVLPVLVYTIWFAERPPQTAHDPYAGALDGLVWRVVLDPQGRPLLYDSIHPCGCFHYWYPAQPLTRRDADSLWREPALVPQGQLPPNPAGGRWALRVASATHQLRRVLPADGIDGERRDYRLRPYAELTRLPDPRGGLRSLFGRDGLVAGSERGERWWLWVSGVPEPGAMRRRGRQATAFVGRQHFDDARLLEQVFEVPEAFRDPALPAQLR